jgi:hypothetical protein
MTTLFHNLNERWKKRSIVSMGSFNMEIIMAQCRNDAGATDHFGGNNEIDTKIARPLFAFAVMSGITAASTAGHSFVLENPVTLGWIKNPGTTAITKTFIIGDSEGSPE